MKYRLDFIEGASGAVVAFAEFEAACDEEARGKCLGFPLHSQCDLRQNGRILQQGFSTAPPPPGDRRL